MGHKVHPKIFRMGELWTWDSRWFRSKNKFAESLELDHKIRVYLKKELKGSSVDSIKIEMSPRDVTITILTGKPGMIIGRGGAGIEELRKKIQSKFFKTSKDKQIRVNVLELGNPSLSSTVIAEQMAMDLEKRMPFRRVLKGTIERAQRAGALGIKVAVSGRLNGAEIARREWLTWGKVPLATIRSDIDFALGEAHTIYGAIGIKVWVYKGERFGRKDRFVDEAKEKSFSK
ncbi:MAG: 30S ribosomal protein S3 [Candidatus Magasanikbacteria bacterium RIFCSPHIGHO2_02_FULL_50_9b]|uniref:Small ribosomal subunit protein uS3 n=1 Tax=Candidatus Magasanikbacteria bacterium RIFCSPHIGHO2_02_FULL_50_9b TaxID=1798682 RepID=A0A1F6M7A4_9BACT|nr:MAG: 30S ribosomal protein S3 [Candidatus Magasanikbacteria bacterium RIFCSPHIGHO2_02_FULL_50_9b]